MITEEQYKVAVTRIDELEHAKPGTPEGDELSTLAILVEQYEEHHCPIDPPTPEQAAAFRKEQDDDSTL